jgi:uncharacterized DUF497 family protein
MPQFEFDPAKSEANRLKHGIDFVDAQEIWNNGPSFEAPIHGLTEPRFQVLGRVSGKLWSAIITYRGKTIRIISVRRARIRERRKYEEIKQKKGEANGGRA